MVVKWWFNGGLMVETAQKMAPFKNSSLAPFYSNGPFEGISHGQLPLDVLKSVPG